VKFISGVTKTREAAEREKREQGANAINDPELSGVNISHGDRESTGAVMEKAQSEAERSRQRGASEEDVPERSMHVLRSPSAERGELGTTLPVVEEAVESSSTGGRSGRSTESSFQPRPANGHEPRPFEPNNRDEPHQKPPPTPPKDSGTANSEERPPTPPKDARYSTRHSGPPTPPKEEKGRGRDKQLPLPPPLETYVHVN
jgi:1-phosphatidylinositol-4-phosphate 5-kinase